MMKISNFQKPGHGSYDMKLLHKFETTVYLDFVTGLLVMWM